MQFANQEFYSIILFIKILLLSTCVLLHLLINTFERNFINKIYDFYSTLKKPSKILGFFFNFFDQNPITNYYFKFTYRNTGKISDHYNLGRSSIYGARTADILVQHDDNLRNACYSIYI